MAGVIVALSLVASLLLVHFSVRGQPMPRDRPLDVETGLPLPEAGQASTVFSLTALFGAYFGIHLLLGLPALLGLMAGTGLALWLIRRWIEARQPQSFEQYLAALLKGDRSNASVFVLAFAGVQCAYASSELIILRHVTDASLGIRSENATLFVMALAVIAYFYVLFGGYIAVFRTDVLQFALVTTMAIIVAALAIGHSALVNWSVQFVPRPGYWEIAGIHSTAVLYLYHFTIGAVMGLGFLVASPDAWKRVFLVSAAGRRRQVRFWVFLAAAMAPFAILIPMGALTPLIPDGDVNPSIMWAGILSSDILFVATALGLIASFLSAFNGALLSGVHLGLMVRRRLSRVDSELPRFHWLMVAALLTIFFTFAAMKSLHNPYILANMLLGPYAILAGVQVGTWGNVDRLIGGALIWVMVISVVSWFIYFVSQIGFPSVPTTYEINTVPVGVLLFLVACISCRLLRRKGEHIA